MPRNHRIHALLAGTALLLTSFTVLEDAGLSARPRSNKVSRFQGPRIEPGDVAPMSAWAQHIRAANRRPSAPPTVDSLQTSEPLVGGGDAAAPENSLEAIALSEPHGQLQPQDLAATGPIASRLPIIEYHYSTFYFDGVRMRTEWYVEQLEWLAESGYHSLTIDELAEFIEGDYAPPLRSVALTFDVGISHFDDYSEVVIPTLRRLGLHGIFFVQPGGVREQCDGEFTCWPALRAWLAEGVISIGSHTITHRDFASLSPAEIAYELAGSQQILREKLGVEVIGVCYPFDSISPAAFPMLESLGYRFAVAGYSRTDRSVHAGEAQPYALPRVYPYSSDDFYPAISGAAGQSFPELIEASVSE